MADPRWLTPQEARAWRGLQFMKMRLDAQLDAQLASDSGLTAADYAVLVALTDQPDGRVRAFELAGALGWEKSRLSHHVTRMVGRGLVSKEACDADRRGAFVVITKKGRREIEAAAPGHVAAVRSLFIDLLTPAQLDALAEMAEAVLEHLARQGPPE